MLHYDPDWDGYKPLDPPSDEALEKLRDLQAKMSRAMVNNLHKQFWEELIGAYQNEPQGQA